MKTRGLVAMNAKSSFRTKRSWRDIEICRTNKNVRSVQVLFSLNYSWKRTNSAFQIPHYHYQFHFKRKFRTKLFLCLRFRFVLLRRKNIGAKSARKMLVKLTPGRSLYEWHVSQHCIPYFTTFNHSIYFVVYFVIVLFIYSLSFQNSYFYGCSDTCQPRQWSSPSIACRAVEIFLQKMVKHLFWFFCKTLPISCLSGLRIFFDSLE